MSLQFVVERDRCHRCGECIQDCPTGIIVMEEDGLPVVRPDREANCLRCQHCLAICPNAAISIFGRDPAASALLTPDALPTLEQMERLVRGRRTVRQYEQADVDPALLDRLLAALCNAPTGVNEQELTFTVIDTRAKMTRFRAQVHEALASAADEGRLPPQAAYLRNALVAFREKGRDILFRGAPHALIVSAPPDAPCAAEDTVLAVAYFEFLARSAGLGTVWWGMFRSAMEALPELKALVGLPADHRYYAMLFGVPAVHYARTVQRDDGAVVRRLDI